MGELYNRPVLKGRRKELRNKPTYAENLLWQSLKNQQLEGKKFRRQQSLGIYIADFCCPLEHLVIELDGADHFTEEGLEYDRVRTEYLNSLGFTVIRFENQEVLYNISYVLGEIKKHLKKD